MDIEHIAEETISATEVRGIQHAMKLSDEQLCDVLGFTRKSGLKRIRFWKAGKDTPSGPAAKLLKLLYRIDQALRVADNGEHQRAVEMIREATPEELQ